jgi:hypothetical protein
LLLLLLLLLLLSTAARAILHPWLLVLLLLVSRGSRFNTRKRAGRPFPGLYAQKLNRVPYGISPAVVGLGPVIPKIMKLITKTSFCVATCHIVIGVTHEEVQVASKYH